MAVDLSRSGWTAALAGSLLLHAGLAAGLVPLIRAGQTGKMVTEITFSEPPAENLPPVASANETSRAVRGTAGPLAAAETAAVLPSGAGPLPSPAIPVTAQALTASFPLGGNALPIPAAASDPLIAAEMLSPSMDALAVQGEAAAATLALSTGERAGFAPGEAVRRASSGTDVLPVSPGAVQAGSQEALPLEASRSSELAASPDAAGRLAVALPEFGEATKTEEALSLEASRSSELAASPDAAGRLEVAFPEIGEATKTEGERAAAAAREPAVPALPQDAVAPPVDVLETPNPSLAVSAASPVRPVVSSVRKGAIPAADSATAAPPAQRITAGFSPDNTPVAAAPVARSPSGILVSAPPVVVSNPAVQGNAARLAPLSGGAAIATIGSGARAAAPLPALSPSVEHFVGRGPEQNVALAIPNAGGAGGTGRGSAAWRQAVDFVRGFDGGGCFAAMPVEKGAAIGLEAFSADGGAMRRFERNSAEVLSAPLDVRRGGLAAIQCSALQIARDSKLYPDFTLSIALDEAEDALGGITGEIRGAGKRAVHLLVIDEAGEVQTVQRFAADSADFRFDFPFSRSELAAARGLFLAVASDAPLSNLRFDVAMRSPEFFRLLDQESQANGGALDIAMVAFDLDEERVPPN